MIELGLAVGHGLVTDLAVTLGTISYNLALLRRKQTLWVKSTGLGEETFTERVAPLTDGTGRKSGLQGGLPAGND